MVRWNGPVGAMCPNGEVLPARAHGGWRRATSSSAAPTYNTRTHELPPDEIARYRIACVAGHVGDVGVVAGSNFLFFRPHQTIPPHATQWQFQWQFLAAPYGTE